MPNKRKTGGLFRARFFTFSGRADAGFALADQVGRAVAVQQGGEPGEVTALGRVDGPVVSHQQPVRPDHCEALLQRTQPNGEALPGRGARYFLEDHPPFLQFVTRKFVTRKFIIWKFITWKFVTREPLQDRAGTKLRRKIGPVERCQRGLYAPQREGELTDCFLSWVGLVWPIDKNRALQSSYSIRLAEIPTS